MRWSLRRLRVDRIDVYQLHAIDTEVPFEDQIGAMRELREAGKVRHVGLSNVDLEQLKRAQKIVEIVSVQNNYNVGNRTSEPVLKYCEANGIAFVPYFPLDGGDLRGKSSAFSGCSAAQMPVSPADGAGVAATTLAGDAAEKAFRERRRSRLGRECGRPGLALDDDEYRQLCSLGGEEE